MKGVKAGFSFSVDVGPLLVKVFDSLKVTHVSGIQEGREAFLIFVIEPLDDLLLVVFLIYFVKAFFGLGLASIQFGRVLNVQLDDIKLIFIGEFVEDIVLGFVKDLNRIEVWVFGEKLVDFRQIAAFKKNPLDFFLLVLWEHLGMMVER